MECECVCLRVCVCVCVSGVCVCLRVSGMRVSGVRVSGVRVSGACVCAHVSGVCVSRPSLGQFFLIRNLTSQVQVSPPLVSTLNTPVKIWREKKKYKEN